MAMEPMGSIAGIAASLQGFISTFSGALVGISDRRAIQRHHDAAGRRRPCAAGFVSLGFVLLAEKGRLFRAHHSSSDPRSPRARTSKPRGRNSRIRMSSQEPSPRAARHDVARGRFAAAIVEANDDGLYVLKFRGAGQGPKAVELQSCWPARSAGLPDCPCRRSSFAELPADLARTEPDAEIQSLIGASAGLNLALDYLPGSVNFDPLVFQPDASSASAIVWFDCFRLQRWIAGAQREHAMWHRRLWLIDHGAALYFHHA